MNRFIAVETDRCIGCGTCLAACSEAHRKVGLQAEPRLSLVKTSGVSAAVTCHHCEGAPCLQVCPVAAISRVDGAVYVNEQMCIGCKLCAVACPFGAIHPSGTSIAGVVGVAYDTPTFPAGMSSLLKWEIGVTTCAVKCDMCSFDPEGPHCVKACLTDALRLVDGDAAMTDASIRRRWSAQASELAMRTTSRIRRS